MNSVIMDNVELGDECIVGALSFIKESEKYPQEVWLLVTPQKLLNKSATK